MSVSIPSIKFKSMMKKLNQTDRMNVLNKLVIWTQQQCEADVKANNLVGWLSNLSSLNLLPHAEFINHSIWFMCGTFDDCVSFREIVKAKLDTPSKSVKDVIDKRSRKTIPKKIRAQVWTNTFGSSTHGVCHCCNSTINCLDSWHAGHIVASANGGSDTAENLRPICVSCNLSMGSEHMDSFKTRCYPVDTSRVVVNGKTLNLITKTH
jgi:hypothetical protein